MISQPEAMKQKLAHEAQQAEAAGPATNFVSRKQLRAKLDAATEEHDNEQLQEQQKRMFVERNDGIDFWRDTAMFWHRQAVQRMNALDSTRHEVAGLTREIKLRGIECEHHRAEAAQCHADTMSAERRSDAFSDILAALTQGYQMDPFVGRATWWNQDTDTLAQIAKHARDWQDQQAEKPPVYIGAGEGEPFTMGGQEFRPEDQPVEDIPFIVWEWGYMPASLNGGDIVEAKLANGLVACGIASNVQWDGEDANAVTAYRVLRYAQSKPEEPTKAEVEAEELIGIANHLASSINSLPDEFEPWASEIHQRIRQVARRLNEK